MGLDQDLKNRCVPISQDHTAESPKRARDHQCAQPRQERLARQACKPGGQANGQECGDDRLRRGRELHVEAPTEPCPMEHFVGQQDPSKEPATRDSQVSHFGEPKCRCSYGKTRKVVAESVLLVTAEDVGSQAHGEEPDHGRQDPARAQQVALDTWDPGDRLEANDQGRPEQHPEDQEAFAAEELASVDGTDRSTPCVKPVRSMGSDTHGYTSARSRRVLTSFVRRSQT